MSTAAAIIEEATLPTTMLGLKDAWDAWRACVVISRRHGIRNFSRNFRRNIARAETLNLLRPTLMEQDPLATADPVQDAFTRELHECFKQSNDAREVYNALQIPIGSHRPSDAYGGPHTGSDDSRSLEAISDNEEQDSADAEDVDMGELDDPDGVGACADAEDEEMEEVDELDEEYVDEEMEEDELDEDYVDERDQLQGDDTESDDYNGSTQRRDGVNNTQTDEVSDFECDSETERNIAAFLGPLKAAGAPATQSHLTNQPKETQVPLDSSRACEHCVDNSISCTLTVRGGKRVGEACTPCRLAKCKCLFAKGSSAPLGEGKATTKNKRVVNADRENSVRPSKKTRLTRGKDDGSVKDLLSRVGKLETRLKLLGGEDGVDDTRRSVEKLVRSVERLEGLKATITTARIDQRIDLLEKQADQNKDKRDEAVEKLVSRVVECERQLKLTFSDPDRSERRENGSRELDKLVKRVTECERQLKTSCKESVFIADKANNRSVANTNDICELRSSTKSADEGIKSLWEFVQNEMKSYLKTATNNAVRQATSESIKESRAASESVKELRAVIEQQESTIKTQSNTISSLVRFCDAHWKECRGGTVPTLDPPLPETRPPPKTGLRALKNSAKSSSTPQRTGSNDTESKTAGPSTKSSPEVVSSSQTPKPAPQNTNSSHVPSKSVAPSATLALEQAGSSQALTASPTRRSSVLATATEPYNSTFYASDSVDGVFAVDPAVTLKAPGNTLSTVTAVSPGADSSQVSWTGVGLADASLSSPPLDVPAPQSIPTAAFPEVEFNMNDWCDFDSGDDARVLVGSSQKSVGQGVIDDGLEAGEVRDTVPELPAPMATKRGRKDKQPVTPTRVSLRLQSVGK